MVRPPRGVSRADGGVVLLLHKSLTPRPRPNVVRPGFRCPPACLSLEVCGDPLSPSRLRQRHDSCSSPERGWRTLGVPAVGAVVGEIDDHGFPFAHGQGTSLPPRSTLTGQGYG